MTELTQLLDLTKIFYFHDVVKIALKENKGTYIHVVNNRQHDKNQHHKTRDVDNGVRPGGTKSPGPGVNMV